MFWRLCAEACGAETMCYSTERSVLSSGVRCTKNDQNGSRFTSLVRSSRASDMDRGGTRSQITRSYTFVLQLTVITVINVSEIKRHQKFTVDGLRRVVSETVTSLFKRSASGLPSKCGSKRCVKNMYLCCFFLNVTHNF